MECLHLQYIVSSPINNIIYSIIDRMKQTSMFSRLWSSEGFSTDLVIRDDFYFTNTVDSMTINWVDLVKIVDKMMVSDFDG